MLKNSTIYFRICSYSAIYLLRVTPLLPYTYNAFQYTHTDHIEDGGELKGKEGGGVVHSRLLRAQEVDGPHVDAALVAAAQECEFN